MKKPIFNLRKIIAVFGKSDNLICPLSRDAAGFSNPGGLAVMWRA